VGEQGLGGLTVLVVDDDADIRELIRMVLTMKGCRVVEAADGRQALELAQQVHPALILMDLSMPVIDGYEATRRLKAQPELCGIPVIAVSAHCDPQHRQKALAAGCSECVGKPVDFNQLGELLKSLLVY
jgi:two-component system cell cycle response regulator DivK